MENKTLVYLYFVFILTLEATALYCVKYYQTLKDTKEKSLKWWVLGVGVLCYALIPFFLYKIISIGEGIAVTNILWNIASTVYGLVIGMAIFGEVVTNLQMIGAVIGVLGIILIIWGEAT